MYEYVVAAARRELLLCSSLSLCFVWLERGGVSFYLLGELHRELWPPSFSSQPPPPIPAGDLGRRRSCCWLIAHPSGKFSGVSRNIVSKKDKVAVTTKLKRLCLENFLSVYFL
ncbi:unnamed protein product [Caretta caretta]